MPLRQRVSTVTLSDGLTPVDMAVSNINEAKPVVNELLCFVGNNYDSHPKNVILDMLWTSIAKTRYLTRSSC